MKQKAWHSHLKITPDSPDYIKSVISVGYKFEVP